MTIHATQPGPERREVAAATEMRERLLAFCQRPRHLEFTSQDPDAMPEKVSYAATLIEEG